MPLIRLKMRLLVNIILNFIRKNSKPKNIKSDYIFYKIVDLVNNEFSLQCINTSALFYAKITDIVFDTDILKALHPIQSCFIGIEYAQYMSKHDLDSKPIRSKNDALNQHSLSRYGCYNLCYQNRNGELCFINNITNQQFIMDPQDIAFSAEIISEFDATQAFYIGFLTGLKINHSKLNINHFEVKRPSLRLVK